MKILQLCKKFPYPAKDGESVAVLSMSEGIAACGSEIGLLAMNTSKHFVGVDIKADALAHYKFVKSVFVENEVDPLDAFLNLFSKKSYNIQRFISEPFEVQLIELLQNHAFDIIQLESLYMVPYVDTIKKHSNAKVVMRSHNLEFEIWNDLAVKSQNPVLSWYYGLCARRLKRYELSHLNDFDSIVFISDEDAKKYIQMGYDGPYLVSPVGFDVSKYKTRRHDFKGIKKLGYIGSLDWKPNIEGVMWFLEEVWPEIHKRFPDLEYHLAGRNASDSFIHKLPESIYYHGEIDNALSFIDQLDVLIVPLFSGSGIRVKILESMALSKAVFSTTKGFEGIGIQDKENALLFENANDIIEGLKLCLADNYFFIKLKNNSRQLIESSFDCKQLSAHLLEHYNSLL
jgi:glycosyltransferase involved in cell wall biosynthesis